MFETLSGSNVATIAGYSAIAILGTMGGVKFFNWLQASSRKLSQLSQWLSARKLNLTAEIIDYVASRDLGGAGARTVEIIKRVHEGGQTVLDDLLKPHFLESIKLRVQDQECVEAFEAELAAYRQSVAAKAKRTLADAATRAP